MPKEKKRQRDIPSILLLSILIFFTAERLAFTEWVPSLHIVKRLAFLGGLLGFLLGYSSFRKLGVYLLTLLYSLVIIPWQLTKIIVPPLPLLESFSELSTRLESSFQLYTSRQAVEDPLLVILLFSILFWSIAIYVGFFLLRTENNLLILAPTTIAIISIQQSDYQGEEYLWVLGYYFFFSLLLLGRFDYLQNQERWKRENVFVISDVKLDIILISFASFFLVALLAWNLPDTRSEWQEVSRWWYRVTHKENEDMENLFSAIDNPSTFSNSEVFFGSELPLGNISYQGKEEVVIVHPPEMKKAPPRYYWRVRSYDTYQNQSWSNASGEIHTNISAGIYLPHLQTTGAENAVFTFTNQTEGLSYLLIIAQPISVDRNVEATYVSLPDKTLDLNLLKAKEQLFGEEQYTLRAALIAPTIKELRAAGTNYPDWVQARYLQLPADLPQSIHDLAAQLAEGKETPYDTASAIINRLRATITYAPEMPETPRGSDALEWFLFTSQEGYCNYSASAAVVLFRAAGIPARLAVGFSEGKANEAGDFVVLRKDAHAWVEAYFPEIGWVEFEPTLNQERLLRPAGESTLADTDTFEPKKPRLEGLEEEDILLPEDVEAEVPPPSGFNWTIKVDGRKLLFWGMIVLLGFSIFFALRQVKRQQVWVTRALRSFVGLYEKNNRKAPSFLLRWLRWRETDPVVRAFYEINKSLRALGEAPSPDLTAHERAALLKRLLPESEQEIALLLAEHEKVLYTPEQGDLAVAFSAQRQIRRQRFRKRLKRH